MGTITGKIRAVNKRPIPDASVVIIEGMVHQDIAALTNEDGKFSLSNLESGQYKLKIVAEGFIAVQGRVPVRPRFTTHVNITLEEDFVPEIN